MASSEYKIVKIYLHKVKDRGLLEYIKGLPGCLKQKYLREALSYYKRQLEDPGMLVNTTPVSEEQTPPAGGVNVLKKVSL